jgi:hypothetical protein
MTGSVTEIIIMLLLFLYFTPRCVTGTPTNTYLCHKCRHYWWLNTIGCPYDWESNGGSSGQFKTVVLARRVNSRTEYPRQDSGIYVITPSSLNMCCNTELDRAEYCEKSTYAFIQVAKGALNIYPIPKRPNYRVVERLYVSVGKCWV